LFRDELLERGRGTMYLTPKAEALRAPLKSLLANLVELVDPPEVPLAEIRQTLRIATADYPALFVIGPLQQELQNSAPGIEMSRRAIRRHPENERCRQLASSKFCCGTRNVRYLALWSTLAVPTANFGLIKFLELSSSLAR
jgi:DNA-binding transcriptional LysR family regulator